MRGSPSTAIATRDHSQQVALPADLMAKAKDYAEKSRSERTLKEYGTWWRKFEAWCERHGRDAMPATVDTLCAYMTWLADGQQDAGKRGAWADGHRLSISSISVATSAIKFAHRARGHALDMQHPALQAVWSGIRRDIAKTRTVRRVRPLLNSDLREMLDLLRQDVPREARDAAILALGWAGALRRSEIAGLDYAELGAGPDITRKGYIEVNDKGIEITLMTSKASQDVAEKVVIPRQHAGVICAAIENWISVGKLAKGAPLFRGVKGRGWAADIKQSGYPGVSWSRREEKWLAQIRVGAQVKRLGSFDDDRQAYVAYCKAKGIKPKRSDEDVLVPKRFNPGDIASVVKRRVRMLVDHRNREKGRKKMTADERAALAAQFSGHSMRAGYTTSAAQENIPRHRIKQQTRHKSDSMLSVYIREVDLHKNSGLKGVGF